MKQLPKIKVKGTLTERTFEILKDAIINLELKPGELIKEEEISKQIGVSRTPIRAAFNRLVYEGLLKIVPGKGTFVAELTEKQVEDLLSVRELLEGLSIELAATLRTEEDLKNMRYILHRQEEALTGEFKSKKVFLDIDSELHNYIAGISQNEYLQKQLSSILMNSRRFLNATTADTFFLEVIREHKELYKYIENQNTEKAKEHMQNHIHNIKMRMIKNLNIQKD
ncbi:GntR family transcriptional regulator [Clostridiisalibacter paucivorans]|uniref:GntR family transcriptional regulator n=1 Tax=Clostridiisalibacter paucivorans TaxID=408753 RepID=UPI00047E1004|nr:GntR family transcriptional regulator [Clostridiisalibacter paucivorans]